MGKVNGINYYMDLFEKESPSAGSFNESTPASSLWTRRGREYYTIGEIATVDVGKLAENDVGDPLYGNERG